MEGARTLWRAGSAAAEGGCPGGSAPLHPWASAASRIPDSRILGVYSCAKCTHTSMLVDNQGPCKFASLFTSPSKNPRILDYRRATP